MALSDEEKREIQDMIAKAVSVGSERRSATRRRGRPSVDAGLPEEQAEKLIVGMRYLLLPGPAKSRYLYAFLLDDENRPVWRVRIPKHSMHDLMISVLGADRGYALSPDAARVELHGTFDVTSVPSPT